ncbi:GntR family transcriptional regulator [Streptomyces sp. NPDC001678]|uniref:GntR family transcriptional regulator n=1 Tax=Streptomyces sp. NPDC001678 TaxID=3364599 RepID=UPI0036B1112A
MANSFVKIADDLRKLIEAGEFQQGQRLPAEASLADLYQVSTPTLRSALILLEADGLVEKRHGKGNYVRRLSRRLSYVQGQTGHSAVEESLQVHVQAREVKAPKPLAELLDVRPGAALAEYVYLSVREASPQALTRVYVPHAVARLNAPADSPSPWGNDVPALLSEAGVEVATTADRLVARLPNADEAAILRIARTVPVTAIERTLLDRKARVVAVALLTLRGHDTEAVFFHETPAAIPGDSPLRRLPWNTPEGNPCFLSAAEPAAGKVAQIADSVEAEQVKAGVEVLAGARAVLDEPASDRLALMFALTRAVESLEEVLRVAEGRGAPMPPTGGDEPSDGNEATVRGDETAKAPE